MSDTTVSQTEPISEKSPLEALARHNRGPSVKLITLIVLIFAVGVFLTAFTCDVTRVSEAGVRIVDGKPFLPAQFADWTSGEAQDLSDAEKAILPEDTVGARRVFHDLDNNEVFCSIVLAGRDVTSIHRPELCLPGQGFEYSEFIARIPIGPADGGQFRVMRMNAVRTLGNATARSIFLYWFIGNGRTTPYHWQRIIWTTKDRVFHNRNHRWAYILINAPVMAQSLDQIPAAESHTMRVLTKFVHDIYPELVP